MMSENGKAIIEALGSLLADSVMPEAIREIERSRGTELVWAEIESLGYCDAMLREDCGGGGINLADLGEIAWLCGYHALPFPLADTIVARAAWEQCRSLNGPILLALGRGGSPVMLRQTPQALVASWIVAAVDDEILLVDAPSALLDEIGTFASLAASGRFPSDAAQGLTALPVPLLRVIAALRAADMAGSMARVAELTSSYAMERKQFGKAIGSFQAIQQQVAVLGEEAGASGIAARRCFQTSGHLRAIPVAVAKLRANQAASRVLEISHAVHGAIGISEEYALQAFSRRLIERRLEGGSAEYWARAIGETRLARSGERSIDFVREEFA